MSFEIDGILILLGRRFLRCGDRHETNSIFPTKFSLMDEDRSITLFVHVMHARYVVKGWMWLMGGQ